MIMQRYSLIRAIENDQGRPTAGPASGIHDRHRSRARNPLLGAGAVLQHVLLYACGEGYLFLGGVSTSWRDAWGERPKVTPQTVVGQSLSCLVWGVESGCRFGGKSEWKSSWNKMSTCVLAARGGDVEALQYARRLGCKWSERACATAAREGHLEVIQWSRAHGCPWNALTCAWAARGGHLRVLRWCRANGCPWDEMTCVGAAAGGHLGVLQWCRANGCPWGSLTFAAAAGAGDLPILEWCKANGCSWITSGEPGWDAPYGSNPEPFEFVSWLSYFTRSQLLLGGAIACAAAAHQGHLEAMQWCRANGCRWDEMTCAAAASRGDVEVLQWCRENGCPWDSSTCTSAATARHLALLIWCHARGCPLDEATCEGAARHGHLEVLQWCRAHGCRWDKKTWSSAVTYGHSRILRWCKVSGCPTSRGNGFVICQSLDILRWLHANNLNRVDITSTTACWVAAFTGNLEMLQWLRAEGCPWTKSVCDQLARFGHLDVLKWCTANGCPWDARSCASEAVFCQQLHVIRWLEARRWSFLARFPILHRSAMLATQEHLHTCAVVAGACAIFLVVLAGALGAVFRVLVVIATAIGSMIILREFPRRTFVIGFVDGAVMMSAIFGIRHMITSPSWIGGISMILGGVEYVVCRRLTIRALAG